MSDIQEQIKQAHKRAEENDLIQIAYKMTENTLLMKQAGDKAINILQEKDKEINRLNNIIDETTKYVKSLSSSGRGCDIYDDIKKEILNKLKGDNK